MTRNLVLALSLVLGTIPLATSPARACGGGYGHVEDPRLEAVRAAVSTVATRRFGPQSAFGVGMITIDGDTAHATVHVRRDEVFTEYRVTLRQRQSAWRVLSFALA
jgi:hypothetical protein